MPDEPRDQGPLRLRLAEVIFGHETAAGKTFDVVLIVAIVASVASVMLETVPSVEERFGDLLRGLEWGFTLLFTAEYLLRLWSAPRRVRYATSFFGLVDLAAILPTWLSLVLPGAQALLSVRALRLLRVFRVLKLGAYVSEGAQLWQALRQSRRKVTVFLATVVTLVVIIGSLMYLVEGKEHGFTSIPVSVYWAVVTLTTVGYGDIAPKTPLGQLLASAVMILGYGIIAVPTGIVTVELGNVGRQARSRPCPSCALATHDADARFCKRCGETLA